VSTLHGNLLVSTLFLHIHNFCLYHFFSPIPVFHLLIFSTSSSSVSAISTRLTHFEYGINSIFPALKPKQNYVLSIFNIFLTLPSITLYKIFMMWSKNVMPFFEPPPKPFSFKYVNFPTLILISCILPSFIIAVQTSLTHSKLHLRLPTTHPLLPPDGHAVLVFFIFLTAAFTSSKVQVIQFKYCR